MKRLADMLAVAMGLAAAIAFTNEFLLVLAR